MTHTAESAHETTSPGSPPGLHSSDGHEDAVRAPSSHCGTAGTDHSNASHISSEPAAALHSPHASLRPQSLLTRKSSLDRDSVEGYMVLHVKKPRKKLFSLARPAFYVVADSRKNVLEVFSNESKSELIYLLSLTNALLSFESDDANMVMEKCFCVEAKTWKKRNTVTFRHQAFVFFEESQVRMLLWVKCIHLAIKRASNVQAADRDLFRSSGAASNTSDSPPFTDDDEQQHYGGDQGDDSEATSVCVDGNEASSSSNSHYGGPSAVRKRLVIDPHAAIAPQKEPKTPFNRLNAMFSTHKQQLKSPKSSETSASSSLYNNHKESRTTAAAAVCALLSPKSAGSSSLSSAVSAAATKNPFHCKSASSKSIGANAGSNNRSHAVHSESSAVRKRVERSSGSSSSTTTTTTAASSSLSTTTDAYYEDVRSRRLREYAVPPKIHRYNYQIGTRADARSTNAVNGQDDDLSDSIGYTDPRAPGQTLDTKVAFVLSRCMVLWVAFLGGVVGASIFLPIAAAGVFAHVCRLDDEFFSSTLAMLWVYLVSRFQGSLGVVAIFVTLYLWCYAEFKNQRRIRRVRIADRLQQEESESFANVDIPNWICHPDVDRVEWLNKVFVTGWPYLKIAIRNSLMGSLNPLLDSVRPAFMSSLSLVRIDLGSRTPHISGVKFVSANPLTEEVTLDVEVRIVTDQSLVAELRMVSNLGAAAVVSLRDLFLVGTLRITLNPLCVDWPCFSALSLSFTSRPVFDFSLTAAKINISNVPFASEWLHTFLHDLLNDYFVWPKVVHIPLWDENAPAAAPVAAATAVPGAGPAAK